MSRVPTMAELVGYFARLGAVGFGGPAVLVERMRHDLVDERGWLTEADYKEGIALAQIAPGPLAAQLAIYIGWLRGSLLGATLVAVAFVAPSFLIVLALSAAYVRFGGLAWMQGAFYGVAPAAIAIIANSSWRLVRRTAGSDPVLVSVVVVNAVLTAWTGRELVWGIVASGAIVMLLRHRPPPIATASIVLPAWMVSGIHGPAPSGMLTTIGLFFAKASTIVFGSGLAIIPFMHGGVVTDLRWIDERQFLDAVAVSMITPGPVVITVAFIGFLVAGPLGGSVAALGVFLPTYLFVVLLAGWFRRIAGNPRLRAAIDGVTAAATGAIVGAAIILARRALVDAATVVIFVVALAVVMRIKRVPEPLIVLAAGAVGVALTVMGHACCAVG